ncbi:NUDIX hydrolase [Synechococcus sp. W4D4]|uniref:NUDIX hydrolase n=1 Tax=Synechococcus sp. W4D4 TaxID=3392294 RepID=UPI0039ECB106
MTAIGTPSSSLQHDAPVEVALAVLEKDGCWLLQLRDDLAGIVAPGCWGLFGGHLDPGESPEQALRRELWEEIRLEVGSVEPWYVSRSPSKIRHIFRAPLQIPLCRLDLMEGQDLALFPPELLESGQGFSSKLQTSRPLAESTLEALGRYQAGGRSTMR